jgi:hypothetical protein
MTLLYSVMTWMEWLMMTTDLSYERSAAIDVIA